MRNAIEVLIDTGRRPDEIGCLPWDCLETDEHGKSVLVNTDFKNNRTDCRLPIPHSTAQIIVEQKNAIQARFPNTELTDLVLFPRPRQNSGGTQPYRISHISNVHHRWVNAIPPLLLADGTEFPKLDVAPYSYRHSYAPRHADTSDCSVRRMAQGPSMGSALWSPVRFTAITSTDWTLLVPPARANPRERQCC